MSVRPAMTPHMLRPLHLPNAPVSRRAGASHACASGQYSCSRYPLRKPVHASSASWPGSSQVPTLQTCRVRWPCNYHIIKLIICMRGGRAVAVDIHFKGYCIRISLP